MTERSFTEEQELEQQYSNWLAADPQNLQIIGREWDAEWEKLYWSQETPERPLTLEEQRKVGEYYQQIVDTLEGKTERFSSEVVDEASCQRVISNWGRTSALMELIAVTAGYDREMFIRAMGVTIENAERHPQTSAKTLQIVTDTGLTQVEGSIKRLARMSIVTQHSELEEGVVNYKASRFLDTLNHQRSLEIYQRL